MEHPRINQNAWTKEEDTALVGLARKYNKRHWEKVAQELGVTNFTSDAFYHFCNLCFTIDVTKFPV